MSTILIDGDKNIGSAYELADGTFAWNVVIMGDKVDYRRGRHATEAGAAKALLAGAQEMTSRHLCLLNHI